MNKYIVTVPDGATPEAFLYTKINDAGAGEYYMANAFRRLKDTDDMLREACSGASMPPVKPPKKSAQDQPSVPIQFVWCDGFLHPVDEAKHTTFTGKSCEQIGAVLYVRGE